MSITTSRTVEYKSTWTLTWNFEADLLNLKEELMSPEVELEGAEGRRKVAVANKEEELHCLIKWEASSIGSLGGCTYDMKLQALSPSGQITKSMSVDDETDTLTLFPKYITGIAWHEVKLSDKQLRGLTDNSHRKFRLVTTLCTTDETQPIKNYVSQKAQLLTSTLITFARPASVRLVFPNISTDNLEIDLWVPSKLLSDTSPYLKTLLEAGFAESIPAKGKRRRSERGQQQQPAVDEDSPIFDDSDTEGDDIYLNSTPSHPAPPDDVEYQEIKITAAHFSTWRAVLVWINTGHIEFAPLSSKATYHEVHTETEYRQQYASAHPFLPIPVSPKSVYRLAHLLELAQLQALALTHYKLFVAQENVAVELFSRESHLYDELRIACLDVAVGDWATVKTSKAMAKVNMRKQEGKLPWYGDVSQELLSRL